VVEISELLVMRRHTHSVSAVLKRPSLIETAISAPHWVDCSLIASSMSSTAIACVRPRLFAGTRCGGGSQSLILKCDAGHLWRCFSVRYACATGHEVATLPYLYSLRVRMIAHETTRCYQRKFLKS
jgi:hypothetical protein